MTNEELDLLQIGQRISDRRKKLGWTQETLADRADLSPQFISYAESGKRAMRPENLLRISRSLGVSADYLLTGEVIDKDMLLLGRKLQSLSTAQFRTLENIIDECISLNSLTEPESGHASDHAERLRADAIGAIIRVMQCRSSDIQEIEALQKGMTNRSFRFLCRGEKYIIRIPGEGTDRLIDRRHEAEVYETIAGRGLCDDVVFIDPDHGYKISRFLENVRTCDPNDPDDLKKCMAKLRCLHEMKLKVAHTFDLFSHIDFYESLWGGAPSFFRDYAETKEKVFSLRPYIERHAGEYCLTHIDAVPDNFLFYPTPDGTEGLQLTDWEYAGMQDPHVDIAMFCIYALYDRAQIDQLIDLYFENRCTPSVRAKIYCYIAVCGLLWSNWCEYKRSLGVEFGEYSLRQYRYAKTFYRLAAAAIQEEI